jgi:hypothetical protein
VSHWGEIRFEVASPERGKGHGSAVRIPRANCFGPLAVLP